MTDPDLIYFGHVEGDQIKLPRNMRKDLIAAFQGKEIEVVVRRKKKRKTDRQRKYYFECIVGGFLAAFSDWQPDFGWTKDAVHETLKLKFLPLVREWGEMVIPETGEAIREVMSTEKLTTVECEMYHEHCRKWAAELSIMIPLPNEQAEMAFNF